MSKNAILALADGTVFRGRALGHSGRAVGEVVFNTAMTGYQEILTDPSYHEQLVTLTYPHIGNVGVNQEDKESDSLWCKGLIIRQASPIPSNWRSQKSLHDYLAENRVCGITDVDTRQLTQVLRQKGAQSGCLMSDGGSEEEAIALAREFSGLNGKDLAQEVSTKNHYQWTEGVWQLTKTTPIVFKKTFHVVVYDYGVKTNILRLLVSHGCQVTVVPAKTPAKDVLSLSPDGVMLSNGPGDPAACHYAIKIIQELLEQNIPLLGICLGHQLLALASGAKTVKMKFGHHGANHPVMDVRTQRVYITSQNHGFTVDENTLPHNIEVTYRSLFDNTLQGLCWRDKPAMSFQGHPEASPGPQDIHFFFQEFINLMVNHAKKN